MRTLLKKLFFVNWLRKLVSLALAIIVWLMANRSMNETKLVSDIPIRVINLAPGRTIEGMQANGILNEKISLAIYGNRLQLDEIIAGGLEVVLDAEGKPNEWEALIGKQNLVSLSPEINLEKGIKRVAPIARTMRQNRLVQAKIPITVMQPIGEAPKGYEYLDVFPYQLHLTVVGPEETIKKLKNRGGLQLTFNLNDISAAELDILQSKEKHYSDAISFFVPNAWKKVAVPGLSTIEVPIDDPHAKSLRIDFSRQDLLPIGAPIPVALFCTGLLSPENYSLATNSFIVKKNGVKMITEPLCAQGVSKKFLDLVKDRIQVVIIASPKADEEQLVWNVQLVGTQELENRFVAKAMTESNQELRDVQPHLREDYLRNRFRSYMNLFRLYTPNHQKLKLDLQLNGKAIEVTPQNYL